MQHHTRISTLAGLAFALCLMAVGAATAGDCDLSSAANQEVFVEYWKGLGGEVGLEDEIQTLLRRVASAEPGVLEELGTKYEGASFYSMAFSGIGSAIEKGNSDGASALLGQIDFDALDDDQKAKYASLLLRLGRTDEAEAIVSQLEGGRNIDSGAGAAFLGHYVETLGVEEGIRRYRQLDSNPEMGFYTASSLLERAGNEEARRELFSSPQLIELMPASYTAAMVVADIESLVGTETALDAIAAAHAAMEAEGGFSRKFNLPAMVEMLAREGCSDACLRAAAEPIRREAESTGEWDEEWRKTLAAIGELPKALALVEDARELLKPASEYAAGRGVPSYVLPLIAPLPKADQGAELAGLTRGLLWAEAEPKALSQAIALAGPITDPAPWKDVAGLVVHATYLSDEARLAVREALVRATSPGCSD